MTVDLHTHSTASDGSDPPSQLVKTATALGLDAMALTDHDTVMGIEEARVAADEFGIRFIPGLELSLEYERGGMHLLVLFLEPKTGPLQDRLARLRDGRDDRNRRILERLEDLDMPISEEELAAEGGEGAIGRPHIAAVMMERGYVPDIKTAFDEWLGTGRPAYVPRPRLAPEEAIRLATESGAVTVLAHPHTLGIHTAAEMSELLEKLRTAGLVGLEAVYSSYRQHERDGYAALARRFDLVPSGGSDYHGSYKPGLEMGTGYGDLHVPSAVLDELESRRP